MTIRQLAKGLLLSISSLFLFILMLFLVITLVGHNHMKKERAKLMRGDHPLYTYDASLGYGLKPDVSFEYGFHGDSNTLLCTSDGAGRRVVPVRENASRHVLFFGGSYTFGHGCNDQETIPWQFSELDTSYNAYNYAVEGYGTQHLYNILKRDLTREINPSAGTAFYLYIEHHRERVNYDPFTMYWGYDFPCYTLNRDGELESRGSFAESSRLMTAFWKGVGDLHLWKLLVPVFRLAFGEKVEAESDEDLVLVAELIDAAAAEYEGQFPDGSFVTVIYPGEDTQIGDQLRARGLRVLDLSQSLDLRAIDGIQRDGFHPNGKANAEVAKLLYKYLKDID